MSVNPRLPVTARLLGALALAISSLVMFGANGTPAYACSCIRPDLPTYVDNAEAVFTGEITGRTTTGPRDSLGAVVYTVAVDQVYKGEVGAEATLSTAPHEAACGLPGLPEGRPLLFFGAAQTGLEREPGQAAEADWSINLCNGTGRTSDAELAEVEQLAGAPSPPSATAPDDDASDGPGGTSAGAEDGGAGSEDDGASPWLLGGAGIGALAAAVLAGVLLRRRLS